jgi:4,5-DOPA dioxygenase extradiol
MGTMPVIYLSHGAPPLADHPVWPKQLAAWGQSLPRPTSILIVSAHWESSPLTIGATRTVPLVYDFYGFPERFYQVTYPAPGAPDLARRVAELLSGAGLPVRQDPARGLDHGAYVPLIEMYPEADIPVLQISMPSLEPAALLEVGRRLAPLAEEGVLIIGSGFMTHNLRLATFPSSAVRPPSWSAEFDAWANESLDQKNVDALLDFERKAPAARVAHPTIDHFVPLFVSLGAVIERPFTARSVIDGFEWGLSKRSLELGAPEPAVPPAGASDPAGAAPHTPRSKEFRA